jgi:hypothetical protein
MGSSRPSGPIGRERGRSVGIRRQRIPHGTRVHHTTTARPGRARRRRSHPRPQPPRGAPGLPAETLSLYGAMHLILSVVYTREGNRQATRRTLDQARRIATRVGPGRNDYNTEFGPTNVELHAVAAAVDLGDAGEALDFARQIDATGLSPERQSRLHLDLARAHLQRRHLGEAVAALLNAERAAPEQVQTHAFTRDTARELLNLTGRRATPELNELARRIGATKLEPGCRRYDAREVENRWARQADGAAGGMSEIRRRCGVDEESDNMAPEITYIELLQADGRPGESIVGEVERWRVRIYPSSITSADLERPSSRWGCSGELLSQAADLSEVEVKWTEAGEQWMMMWATLGSGHAGWSVFQKPITTTSMTVRSLAD